MIVAFLALTLLATLTMYVWAEDTDRAFAWTIEPPVSAAFLGGGYASGFLLIALTTRERTWANARIALVTVTLFVWLTTVATLLHLDLLHFNVDGSPGFSQFSAWLWFAVYIVVPVWMAVTLVVQPRAPGTEPLRLHPLPGQMTAILVAQGIVMLGAGVSLMAAPQWVTDWWPWVVAPFAGRATGAWLIALGTAAMMAAIAERDFARLRAASWTYLAFALLQAGALARFPDEVRWELVATWAWTALLASMAAVGIHGIVQLRRAPTRYPVP